MRRHRRHAATDETEARSPAESAVPKILGILMAFMLLRVIIKVGHRVSGSPAMRARRHATIAELHRRLHSEDAA
ncbi:MAG TPA: hypothetical protein VF365_03420 [Candidatus Limnocylindria bacterium]